MLTSKPLLRPNIQALLSMYNYRVDGGFSGDSPPKLTWHHGDSPGSLQVIDRLDHKTYHKIYHPDGTGGRNKWGGGTACR
nr:HNH endonuclease [Pseudomonas putida]